MSCVLFRASKSHITDKNNSTEFSFKEKKKSDFTLTLSYPNLALNNPAVVFTYHLEGGEAGCALWYIPMTPLLIGS